MQNRGSGVRLLLSPDSCPLKKKGVIYDDKYGNRKRCN